MRARAHSTRVKSTGSKYSAHTTQAPALRVIGGKWRGLKLYMPESKEPQESKNTTESRAPHSQVNLANASVKRDSATTRPTKSIVRESFFNTLAHEIYGACFIEGFAGSGSMGIEALSRGARVGVFCEQDLRALHALERNLSLLPIATHHALDFVESKGQDFSRLDSGALDLIDCVSLCPQAEASQRAYMLRGDSFISLPSVLAWLESCALKGILYLDPPFCIRENYADIYEKCANLAASISSLNLRHIIIEHSSEYMFAQQIGRFVQHKTRRFGKSTLTYFTQGA